MSKAIQGLAMIGGAIALGVTAAVLASSGVGFAALPFLLHASEALALGGISMEAAALSAALTTNRGANITVRQAAGYRQIIYGTQRVGGTMIYLSTTGSKHDQVNYVIVIAGHEIDSILGFYLDGRKVNFESGVGNSTRNGVNFGGNADHNTYTGPGGAKYNFGGLVYVHAYYGDQTSAADSSGGGFDTGLQANDPTWAPGVNGTPYVGGCAYLYFKYEYDAVMFPQPPEARITVRGKNNILDPRTGTRGYTSNWALICADVITDTQFGLGDDSVNQAQLIVAANVCDEQVALAAGGTESRYACHYHYDSSTSPGQALAQMMPAAAGRFSRSSGEWFLWPAYWQGPSFEFDEGDLASEFVWNPTRERRDLFNRVTGTYTAANYPYNATTENGSNLYDPNGFYDGTIQNNFDLAFQATSIPYYAEDALHGFAANQYLIEDGQLLQKDFALPCVLSISQAQRCLKIMLERNRQQGNGTLMMFPVAFRMAQVDVMQFSMAGLGWTEKMLEVASVALGIAPGANGVMCPQVKVGVQETAASVYSWSVTEELSIYLKETAPMVPYIPNPPTNLLLTSSAATAVVGLDGVVYPRVLVSWDEPLDGLTKTIQVQSQAAPLGMAVGPWFDEGSVSVESVSAYVSGLIAGNVYNFRIRGVRASGAESAWVELDGYTVSIVLSQLGDTGVGVGSMVGLAFSDGTAQIEFNPFPARVGNASVPILPAGEVTISNSSTNGTSAALSQAQLYYGYYIDPNFAGGAITPIATQDPTDFRGKQGYFFIDSIVTPTAASGSGPGGGGGGSGTGMRYQPSSSHDVGSRTTLNAANAYDGNSSSFARVSASFTAGSGGPDPDVSGGPTADAIAPPVGGDGQSTYGDCIYQGFASASSSAASTLNVSASVTGRVDSATITATWGGSTFTLLSVSAPAALATYTVTVPAGIIFSDIALECSVAASSDSGSGTANLFLYEIYVQT